MAENKSDSSKLKKIASACKTSVSTVSRALNHCGGIDSEVRSKILSENEKISDKTEKKRAGNIDYYIIMPDTPNYYWNKIIPVIKEGCKEGKRIKLNILTNSFNRDDYTIESYLNEAENVGAPVIIICCSVGDEIKDRLMQLAENRLIIFLINFADVPNTFYIGPNHEADGFLLGKRYIERHNSAEEFLLLQLSDCDTVRKRIEGFKRAISGYKSNILVFEENMPDRLALLPSVLARETSRKIDTDKIGCVFVPDGTTFCAVQTLIKLKKEADCVGFECSKKDEEFLADGKIDALAVTSLTDAMKRAFDAGDEYIKTGTFPEKKFNYTDTKIIEKA